MAEQTKEEVTNLSARLSLKLTPWDWLEKARALRDAFNYLLIRFEEDQLTFDEKLEQDPSLDLQSPDDSVLMMILGFAIENLLKGLYVSTLRAAKRPRKLSELGVSGHGLTVIAKKVETELAEQFSESEMNLLADFEQTIVWHGRYPSPVNADKLISTSGRSLFSAPWFRHPEHHFAACKLYDRLESLLRPRAPFSVQKTVLGGNVYVGRMPSDADGSDEEKRENGGPPWWHRREPWR